MVQILYLIFTIGVVISAFFFGRFIYRKFYGSKVARTTVIFLIFAGVAVFVELFAYNHKSFLSSGYDSFPKEISSEETDDGENKIIKLKFNETEVKNIYVDGYSVIKEKIDYLPVHKAINVKTTVYDSANEKGYTTSVRPVAGSNERSKYIEYNLTESVSEIDLEISDSDPDYEIVIKGITVNKKVPMMFSWRRTLIIFLIMVILYVLRPGSEIYKLVASGKKAEIISMIVCMCVVFCAVLFTMWLNEADSSFYRFSEQRQYARLAESLRNGSFSIGKAHEYLNQMNNPYDSKARAEMIENGMPYIWDTAYFNGNLYVYFGVVPCVLLYLPYNILTGGALPNSTAYLIFMAGFILVSFLLTAHLRKKLAPSMPALAVHVVTGMAVFGSTVYLSKCADLYCIPIISGLMFSVLGILLWLKSLNRKKGVSAVGVFFGSLSMALVMGSRPQLIILALLAVPIFWKAVFKNRTLFSKKGTVSTICLFAPFFLVFIPIAYYNFARFGSITDFGANYNLTSNDMTVRGFRIGRIPSALYAYFIEPMKLNVRFPFLEASSVSNTMYQGTVISDPMFGSAFSQMLLWIVPLAFFGKVKNILKNNRTFKYMVILSVFALVIAIADAQMAGVLERYLADFEFILYGMMFIVVFAVYNRLKDEKNKMSFFKVLYFLSIMTCVYLFLVNFVSQIHLLGVHNMNPGRFYRFFYGISFWV